VKMDAEARGREVLIEAMGQALEAWKFLGSRAVASRTSL
jgi:hypothetical protein